MTIELDLPPEIEAGLLAQAQAEGLALSEYVQNLLRDQLNARVGTPGISHPAFELPAEDWARRFQEWAESCAHANLHILSDEAATREFIYSERGL